MNMVILIAASTANINNDITMLRSILFCI